MPEIAVVGMGIAVPGASSPSEFWRLLNIGEPQFSEPGGNYRLDSFWSADPEAEDRGYVRVSGFLAGLRPHPELARQIAEGRFSRGDGEAMALRHCLLQAREGVTTGAGQRATCVIGGTGLTSQQLDEATVVESAAHHIAARRKGGKTDVDALRSRLYQYFGHIESSPALLLPHQVVRAAIDGLLPADCPVIVVDTACSSALYAIDLGARHLLAGDCEIAYCGGMSGVTPRYNTAFSKLGGLSRRGRPRVFDAEADGTLFSEAAAIIVLKTLERALADDDPVLGLLAGFGASSDGRGRSVCAASPAGQVLCIERAQRAAGIDASQVDWIVAHGTGTVAGDAAELAALAETAPPRGRVCASNKPVVGHAGWSAGAVSVIHALLALDHGRIPAHHGLSAPAPGSPIGTRVEVPMSSRPWTRHDGRPRTVGVSSFGFGGTNGHLLIKEHIRQPAAPASVPPRAADPAVLVAWAAHLPGDPSRADVVRMLASRSWMCPRSFGRYEPLPFDEIRLPARTARSTDRSQLMALHVAAMMVAEYGELWAPLRDFTGVIAAQTGPVPLAVGGLLRCYRTELEQLLADENAQALADLMSDTRAQTPATSRDTLPGIMPNIMPARLANRYDLHGLTMLVDSGGRSGQSALDVATLYLATGELDMALVLAVNVDVPAGLARLVDAEPDALAEGAFLLALTRPCVAQRHGLTVLTEVPRGISQPAISNHGDRTFLAADPIVSLLRTLRHGSS